MSKNDTGDIDVKLARKCLADRGYKLADYLISGGQGSLFGFCGRDGNCKTNVVKIILLAAHQGVYEREIDFFNIVNTTSDDHITPKLVDSFTCLGMGFLVQEKFDGDMLTLADNQSYSLLSQADLVLDFAVLTVSEKQFMHMFYLAWALQDSHTIHGDLRVDQFVQRKQGKEMAIIDFGLAGSTLTKGQYQPILGWLPDNFKSKTNSVIPLEFWPYFNIYQLLVYCLERDDKGGFVFLIYRGSSLFYLEDALIFPESSPYHVPAASVVAMNRFLYGQDLMPPPSTFTKYPKALEALKQTFPDLEPYRPLATNTFFPVESDVGVSIPTLKPLETMRKTVEAVMASRKTVEAVIVPTAAPPRKTVEAVIVPPGKTSPPQVKMRLTMPCELEGFEPDVDGSQPVVHGRYTYALFRQKQNGKRYLFRTLGKKWKPYSRSKVTSLKLRSMLGLD